MAASPKIAPQEELGFEEKTPKLCEPKPAVEKPRVRKSLAEILEGHEEFLGWSPD